MSGTNNPSASRYCSYCGEKTINANAAFCGSCGKPFPGIQTVSTAQKNTSNTHNAGSRNNGNENTKSSTDEPNNSSKQKSNTNFGINYYDILEVDSNATQDEIKAKYLSWAEIYHPDKYTKQASKDLVEEKLKIINKAYGILKDPQKRSEYDKKIFGNASPSNQKSETSTSGSKNSYRTSESTYVPSPNEKDKAIYYYQKAWDLWVGTDSKQRDERWKRTVAAYFQQAIENSKEPFPRANSFYALFLNELGEKGRALYHANIALKQNPNEFRAQEVKVDQALENARFQRLTGKDFIPNLNGGELAIATGIVFQGLALIGGRVYTNNTQIRFVNEIKILMQIYINVCKINTDVDEFIYMAERLIEYGDIIKANKLTVEKPDLYALVAKTPITRLDSTGRENDIDHILVQARGR